MNNKKRLVALALATTMVLGCGITAFAADTSGSSTGTGTSEGHVEAKKMNVVLPTITEGTTPFGYIMDPEGLILETEGAKYESGTTFPESASDTGVYFLTAEKTYSNTSSKLTVENQSSHAINLTVDVEVTSLDTDIPLVTEDALTGATAASLYLGLVVDSEDPVAITKESKATKTISLAGKSENFTIAVNANGDGYEYRAKTETENNNQALTWNKSEFCMEGAVTENLAITSTTTAPTVKVTWSWVDPTANAAPSIATTTYTATEGQPIDIAFNLGAGDSKATAISNVMFGKYDLLTMSGYTSISGNVLTLTTTATDYLYTNDVDSATYVIKFDDASEDTDVTITVTKG